MLDLTSKEIVILIVAVIALISLASAVISRSIRLIISVVVGIFIISVGFFWLPEQVGAVVNKEKTASDVVNSVTQDFDNSGIKESVNETIEAGKAVVDENSESWKEAAIGLWDKITTCFTEGNIIVNEENNTSDKCEASLEGCN